MRKFVGLREIQRYFCRQDEKNHALQINKNYVTTREKCLRDKNHSARIFWAIGLSMGIMFGAPQLGQAL